MADSVGIDRHTGQVLTDWDHVKSAIADLLTTRILSRVMLREYGSDFPELIDAPMNDLSLLLFYSAIAQALEQWEPRFELSDVSFLEADANGRVALSLTGQYIPRGHYGDDTPVGVRSAEYDGASGVFVPIGAS